MRIDTPVILAPMSGVTDLPFRRLAKRQGAGMVVSEMIASWAMVRENRNTACAASASAAPNRLPDPAAATMTATRTTPRFAAGRACVN